MARKGANRAPAAGSVPAAGLARSEETAPAQHRDPDEEPEIVPAPGVGNRVNRDVGRKQRSDPRPGEDEAVPQAPPEPRHVPARAHPCVDLARAGGNEQRKRQRREDARDAHIIDAATTAIHTKGSVMIPTIACSRPAFAP